MTSPGRGLRQVHWSASSCGQICQVSNGPEQPSIRAFTARTCSRSIRPRATPDWLLITPDLQAGRPQPAQRRRDVGDHADGSRVAVVGDVVHDRAVAVDEHGLDHRSGVHGVAPAEGPQRRAASAHVAAAGIAALVTAMRDDLARVRGPGAIRAQANCAVAASQARRRHPGDPTTMR